MQIPGQNNQRPAEAGGRNSARVLVPGPGVRFLQEGSTASPPSPPNVPTSNDAPGARIATWWKRLSRVPGGRLLFSIMIGRTAPYTGTIGARVEELGPGHAKWVMRDRRRVRNHLRSVHAVALVNLAEVASGTAMLTALPPGTRGIVTGLSIEYLRKARGTLTAECRCDVPLIQGDTRYEVQSVVTNAEGEVVATANVTWLLRRAD